MSSPGPTSRVVLASTSVLSMLGLRQLIARTPGMEIVAETSCRSGLVQAVRCHRPDLLIVDAKMAAHAEAMPDLPGLRVLLLSSRAHPGALPTSLFVCGSIGARDDLEKISNALDIAGRCAGPGAMGGVCCAQCPLAAAFTPVQILPLSLRESQVFALLGEGMGTGEVAATLSRSVKTIEAHRESIKRKLRLTNAIELIDAARRWVRGETLDVHARAPLPETGARWRPSGPGGSAAGSTACAPPRTVRAGSR